MKHTKKEHILIIIMTIFILLTGGVCFLLHKVTAYPLYFGISMTGFILGGTNLLFLLLHINYGTSCKKLWGILKKTGRVLCFAGYGMVLVFSSSAMFGLLGTMKTVVYPAVFNVVVFIALFVLAQVFAKLSAYVKADTAFEHALLRNSRMFMNLLAVEALLAVTCTLVEAKKLLALQRYVIWLFAIMLLYYIGAILLSMFVNAICKTFISEPYLNIPLLSLKKGGEQSEKAVGFIEYLETNTGISMRSLWSVKFIRQIAPLVIILFGLFLWLSTCIVQVESYQKGAVYRFGVLQEELLGAGIHLTLPYPFTKVEIYDTEVLKKTTIGFRSESSADNLWTSSHQGDEYKLLLGSGDELASINLRLEYKIRDLRHYLKSSAAPESILQAVAYELVTSQTIHTDLTTLLSTDRESFSQAFMDKLTVLLEEKDVGLEVVGVVLESIHPPKEIADVYQKTVSAEIDAQATILEAETIAATSLAKAQMSYDETVSQATSEQVYLVTEAKANIAEFMTSVEAYKTYGEKYTFQKYLNAVREAYGNANLVIVSEGIDQSAIYFGSFSSQGSDNSLEKDNDLEE